MTESVKTDVYIDPLAQVATSAQLGRGTKVWAFTRVAEGAIIGANCQFGQNVYVDRSVCIGNHVKVQNNVSIYNGVTVGDGVFLGPSCVFTNVKFPRAFIERKHEFVPTYVERGVTVGANATIVCGVRLGEFSFVGSGAVVTHDVRPFALVVGSPAHQIGWACACGERLADHIPGTVDCKRCSLAYQVGADGCRVIDPDGFERWWRGAL